MNITDPLNKTGKVIMTLGAAFVLSCCAVYAANKEPKEERIVTTENISIDDEGNKKVVVEFSEGDGVTYIQENDQYYILEGGDKRSMTVAERKDFEKKHEEAQKHLHMTEQELVLVEKELENAHRVLVLHENELQDVEIEIENAHKALAEAQREIEIDYQQGNISKEEMEQAREAILKAKEEMSSGKMRNRIHVDMERARADMEKARADIENQRREIIIKRESGDSTSGSHRVLMIDDEEIINGENKRTRVIKWEEDNGKVYSVENGKYMILENGTKREMTEEEKALFETKIRMIPKPDMPRIPPQPKQPESVNEVGFTKAPKPPQYPKAAAEKGIEGHVIFNFDVDHNGKALNIKVSESVPEGVFDEVALNAFKEWEFAHNKQTQNLKYKLDFKLQ